MRHSLFGSKLKLKEGSSSETSYANPKSKKWYKSAVTFLFINLFYLLYILYLVVIPIIGSAIRYNLTIAPRFTIFDIVIAFYPLFIGIILGIASIISIVILRKKYGVYIGMAFGAFIIYAYFQSMFAAAFFLCSGGACAAPNDLPVKFMFLRGLAELIFPLSFMFTLFEARNQIEPKPESLPPIQEPA